MAEGAQQLVRFENVGGIGVITIDNPPVNALSPGVPEGIVAAVDKGNADPAVKAMVLIGAGRSFIAGADIRQFGRGPSTPPTGRRPYYGYGVPAAAFIVATRQFGSDKDDALVWLLEGGSVLFALALLSLELVHAVYGRLTSEPLDDFTTGAALIALWMVFATALVALGERRRRPVLLWMGGLLVGAATLIEICWQPLMLLFGTEVGSLAIFDALLFADAVPAAVYALVAWRSPARPLLYTTARVLAALFAFAWITLEIRHIFQGRVELFANSGEGEWYAYSAAWLVFAGAALGLGLLRRSRWLRQAGLLGIGLVVAKVFLSDMAALSGVLRALSFLGLGGALVGLGYAYRRFRPLQTQPGS